MPHHKSAAKRVITNEKSRQRNIAARTRMRSALKAVRTATSGTEADQAYRLAASVLDLHNRRKIRIAGYSCSYFYDALPVKVLHHRR